MTTLSPLHNAAREYAAKGWPIFVLHPGTKVPATPHGFKDATVDLGQIDAWFAENPTYNIGFSPHQVGLGIVDLDGPAAAENWELLQAINGAIPKTYTVNTPRPGGIHLYFQGELPPTQSKLADHIDTRGRGSYALLSPSVIDERSGQPAETWGTYRVADDRTPVPLADWVRIEANVKREKAKAAVEAADLPVNIDRARSYLKTAKVAVEGQMGDKQTFVTACDVANLGVSPETALDLMLEHWNPRCEPPWEPDELEVKIANAFAYSQNEAGAWATEPAEKVFAGGVLDKLLAESKLVPAPKADDEYPAPLTAGELVAGHYPPAKYLVDRVILKDGVNLLYGDGGVGKSTLALTWAVHVAAGIDWNGRGVQRAPVIYVTAEDDKGPTSERLEAICANLRVNPADLPLTVWSLPGHDISIATVQDDGRAEPGPFLEPLAKIISRAPGALIILDTLADIGRLDPNKRAPVNAFCKVVLGGLCRQGDATVLVIGHPSKAAMASGAGYDGATAWKNSVRSMLTLKRADDGRIVTLANGKISYGEEGEIELHRAGKLLLPVADVPEAERADALQQSVVRVAKMAAAAGAPIQKNTVNYHKWIVDEIRSDIGRRPDRREIKDALAAALPAKLLSYVSYSRHRMSGFYPFDEEEAHELARQAKAIQRQRLAVADAPSGAGGSHV